jgi:hypothetical protein
MDKHCFAAQNLFKPEGPASRGVQREITKSWRLTRHADPPEIVVQRQRSEPCAQRCVVYQAPSPLAGFGLADADNESSAKKWPETSL